MVVHFCIAIAFEDVQNCWGYNSFLKMYNSSLNAAKSHKLNFYRHKILIFLVRIDILGVMIFLEQKQSAVWSIPQYPVGLSCQSKTPFDFLVC